MKVLEESIKISVLLPVYNAEKYISEAVASILSQTYTNFELIILDDGSTDRSMSIIQGFNDSRIRIASNESNSGLIYTLNKGLKLAKGEYIARMDADDISLPTRFEKQVEFLDAHPEVGVLGTNYETFGKESKKSNLFCLNNEIRVVKYFENPICHPSVMIRKAVIEANNIAYRNDFLHMEDWGFWMDLSKHTELRNLPETLLKYRLEGQNITVKNHESLKARMFKLYQTFLPDLLSEIDENTYEKHWNFVKAKYNEEIDWIKLIEVYSNAFLEQGIDGVTIKKYFDSVSDSLFYGVANVSPKKALKFAKSVGILNGQKRIFLLKKTLKP